MGKSGKRFEILVDEIYRGLSQQYPSAKVNRDEKIEGPDGLRQFDVTLRHEVAGSEYLTVVECKDHKRKLKVEYVDALESKMRDIKASKAILVSPVGFQRCAIIKAARVGIDLCLIGDKNRIYRAVAATIPVFIHRIFVDKYCVGERMGRLREGSPKGPISMFPKKINGKDFLDIIFDGVTTGKFHRLLPGEDFYDWQMHEDLSGALKLNEYFGTDRQEFTLENGDLEIHQNVTLALSYKREWYFGNANDIPSAYQLFNLSRDALFIAADLTDFEKLVGNLSKYENSGAVPYPGRAAAIAFDVIDMRLGEARHYEKLSPR